MKIELNNIKVYDRLSKETTAYSADLFVDGKKVAQSENDGHGGCDSIRTFGTNEENYLHNSKIVDQAEEFCKTLPDNIYESYDGQKVSEPMTLEIFINNLLDVFIDEKEKVKFKKKIEKNMFKGIVVGNDMVFRLFTFKKAFSEILASPNAAEWLTKALADIATKMEAGERFLNTNLPAGTIIPELVEAK